MTIVIIMVITIIIVIIIIIIILVLLSYCYYYYYYYYHLYFSIITIQMFALVEGEERSPSREPEYRIRRLHSPVSSGSFRHFLDISVGTTQTFCILSLRIDFSRFLL